MKKLKVKTLSEAVVDCLEVSVEYWRIVALSLQLL